MIGLRHPLAVVVGRLDWAALDVALKPSLAHQVRTDKVSTAIDLLGTHQVVIGAGKSPVGRLKSMKAQ